MCLFLFLILAFFPSPSFSGADASMLDTSAGNASRFFILVASLNSVPSGLELLRLAEKNWELETSRRLETFPVEENHDGCEATKEVWKTGANCTEQGNRVHF